MTKSEKPTATKKESSVIEINKESLDEAVKFINEKANETLYRGSIEIGEYLLKTFFNGDIKMAASKNPKKQASFNKLCEREDLLVNPNTLGIMVRVASQEHFFQNKKVNTEGLSYTHKASLVKLDNDRKKISLLTDCIKKNWTTRQLELEISKKLKELSSTNGPSPIRTAKRLLKRMDSIFEDVDSAEHGFDLDTIKKMPSGKRKDLHDYLNNLKTKSENGKKKYEDLFNKCESIIADILKMQSEETTQENKDNQTESTTTAPLE